MKRIPELEAMDPKTQHVYNQLNSAWQKLQVEITTEQTQHNANLHYAVQHLCNVRDILSLPPFESSN